MAGQGLLGRGQRTGIGVRAQMAKFSLEAQGYRQVSNEGGFDRLARTLGSVQGPK